MKKKILRFLCLEAVLCIAWVVLDNALLDLVGTLVTFPFMQIGQGLRALSLAGGAGNVLAIGLYVLICLAPAGLLLRKKERQREDLLLVLLSVMLFPVMYLMVNPQLQASWLGPVYSTMGGELLCLVTWSIPACYGLLTVLRKCFAAEQPRLLDYMKWLMVVYCAALVFQVCGTGLDGTLTTVEAIRQANQGSEAGLELTFLFLVVQYLVNSLPDVLFCGILLDVCGMLELLRAEVYTDELITAAENVSRRCGRMMLTVVLSNVSFNLIQLLNIRNLRNVSTVVRMPLDTLVLVIAMLLIARFIRSHKELRDENDAFI